MSDIETKTQTVQESEGDIEQLSSPPEPRELEDGSPPSSRVKGPAPERFITLPAIFNFGLCLQADWEVVGTTFQFALLNGGPASIVYGGILAGFGGVFVAMSLAEMASIDPIVGAQYRWSARFAPAAPRFWALIQGWLTVWAWMVTSAANPANLANIVTALIIFNKEDYVYHRWHTALLMWLFVTVPLIANIFFRRLLTWMETSGFIIHVCFFIATIVTLVVLGERSTNQYVWQTIVDDLSGWTNPGAAFGIGCLCMFIGPVGSDGVLHMSSEVKRVRTNAPRSIVAATIIGAIMQYAFGICLTYTIGDVNAVTNTNTGLPMIEVYYQATKSSAATVILIVAIALVLFVSLFNVLASTSRLTWAFARDKGLPFSHFFSRIHPTFRIPVNALCLISAICFILSLIYIGSSTAFNAIISLGALSLFVSYVLPILFMMIRRIRGPPLEYGPYKLGRYGVAINFLSLAYLIYAIIWVAWPNSIPVTASTFNYAGPIMLFVIFGAFLDWSITGHKRFELPAARPGLEEEEDEKYRNECCLREAGLKIYPSPNSTRVQLHAFVEICTSIGLESASAYPRTRANHTKVTAPTRRPEEARPSVMATYENQFSFWPHDSQRYGAMTNEPRPQSSSTAFDAIIALAGIGLNISYVLPILFFMIKKIKRGVEMGPWSMGWWGIPVNIFALVCLVFVIIWMPFPTELPVTATNMNYELTVFLAVLFGALLDWTFSGRKRFEVPLTRHLDELESPGAAANNS